MNWILFGATGATISDAPQAVERMLSLLIYMVCFILPFTPLIIVGAKRRAYEAVRNLAWAKIAMTVTLVITITILMLIGTMLPLLQTTSPAVVVANVSIIAGFLIMRFAEKKYWKAQYNLSDLVSQITPENKHEFKETDFGDPIGKEKL